MCLLNNLQEKLVVDTEDIESPENDENNSHLDLARAILPHSGNVW